MKLIETISVAIGVVYEPTRVRRKAKADADALVILSKGRAEASEIEARTQERVLNRELRRQENIEEIAKHAHESLEDKVSEQPVSEDWFYRFLDSCQDVGDAQMRILWGRILAGEVARPGAFSFRTLRIVRDLTKGDADLFTKLCKFLWVVNDVGPFPVIHDLDAKHVVAEGLSFYTLKHLASLGLVEFDNTGLHLRGRDSVRLSYCGQSFEFYRDQPTNFHIGQTMFTSVGTELCRIADAPGSEVIRATAIEYWKNNGWALKG